jgi:hypothetical protein
VTFHPYQLAELAKDHQRDALARRIRFVILDVA